ncbi:hypothetical protein QFZ96_004242 [Paraburkholderia youngii]
MNGFRSPSGRLEPMRRRQLDHLQKKAQPAHGLDERIVFDRLAEVDVATEFVAASGLAPARRSFRSTSVAWPSSSSIRTKLAGYA